MQGTNGTTGVSARWAISAVVAVLGLAALFLVWRPPAGQPPVGQSLPQSREPATREELVTVGGVKRPATDVRSGRRETVREKTPLLDYGTAPKIAVDANPQVASVAEHFRTGRFPERVSTHLQPKPFDAEAYARDPQAYLNVVEPGRVWQPAQPGPGVKRLRALTGRALQVTQGEPVALRVQAVPRAPVTFTSFDLGAFHNQLPSVTVAADDKGVATAVFTGTPGTINDVNILAASPLMSGQLDYVVHVSLASQKPPARP